MRQLNHEKCNHQTYSVDLQLDNDHHHDQVQMWIYVAIYICIRITKLQLQPGRRDDNNEVSSCPMAFVTTELVHFNSRE